MNFTTLQNLFWDGIRQRPNFHWISCSRKDTNGQHSNKEADSGMFVLSIDYTMTLWNHVYVFSLIFNKKANNIRESGATSLSEALKTNTTLTGLDLGRKHKRNNVHVLFL